MIRLPFLIVVACFVVASLLTAARSAEPVMIKMVFCDVSPGVDPDSFAAKPRTLYRVGDKMGRSEEVPNPATKLHLLFVVNHPDVWIINLADKTGGHSKDPDPKGVFRVPIVTGPDLPAWTKQLEVGREVEYFNEQKAKKVGEEKVAGKECTCYLMEKEKVEVSLWVDAQGKVPVRISVSHKGKVLKVLEYEKYETGLKPVPDLFAPPKGITIKELK